MRELSNKKRIVIKLGTTTITHEKTGSLDLLKLEKLVRIISDLHNQGKEVIIVSSGAIAVGRKALRLKEKPKTKSMKQACAAIGQARLMMVYEKLFAEYNQISAQILLTKYTLINDISCENACNTINELLDLGVIPIVNENDTVSTDEIELPINESKTSFAFGDNDSLSALVTSLVGGDLLILMSDIDGLYTDDPYKNKDAEFISTVKSLDDNILSMGKDSASDFGTGGMCTKLTAAKIAIQSGADMIIANGKDIECISDIVKGEEIGTIFLANKKDDFNILDYITE